MDPFGPFEIHPVGPTCWSDLLVHPVRPPCQSGSGSSRPSVGWRTSRTPPRNKLACHPPLLITQNLASIPSLTDLAIHTLHLALPMRSQADRMHSCSHAPGKIRKKSMNWKLAMPCHARRGHLLSRPSSTPYLFSFCTKTTPNPTPKPKPTPTPTATPLESIRPDVLRTERQAAGKRD